MKTIGLIIAMLFSVTSWGATPAKIESLEVGGRTFTDLTNLKSLVAYVTGAQFSSFRELDGVTPYVVPAGKSFVIEAMCWVNRAAALGQLNIGHHDTPPVWQSAAPPTAPTYIYNLSQTDYIVTSTVIERQCQNLRFVVLQNKHVHIVHPNATIMHAYVYGYEI